MALLGREAPDLPSEVFFDEREVRVLTVRAAERGKPVTSPLSLCAAIALVARKGGRLVRANDPPPGPRRIWKGRMRLHDLSAGCRLGHRWAKIWDREGVG